MDWPGVLLTAVATVVALWLLLKYELKESEGRNGKAHDDIRGQIKESEGRSNQAHAELSTRIDNGFNRLNDTLMKMSNDVGFIRGWRERGERGKQPDKQDDRLPQQARALPSAVESPPIPPCPGRTAHD